MLSGYLSVSRFYRVSQEAGFVVGLGFGMEKGGKKSSLPPRSSLKSSRNGKGKDDSAENTKKGRKIRFSYEDSAEEIPDVSLKSSGKGDSFTSKVKSSKGGKGDKVANGSKSTVEQAKLPLELKVELELPENATCLMDCEAAEILQKIQEQMIFLSRDPTIKLPPSFDKGLNYSKTGACYTDTQSARIVLENLRKHGVSDGEICVLGNVCPESIEEAFALVPSLKSRASTIREPLKEVICKLAKLKQSD